MKLLQIELTPEKLKELGFEKHNNYIDDHPHGDQWIKQSGDVEIMVDAWMDVHLKRLSAKSNLYIKVEADSLSEFETVLEFAKAE